MSTWANNQVATLKAKKTDGTTLSLAGVNSSNAAGTPEQFIAATNHLLSIVGESVIVHGVKRVIEQEAEEE